MNHLLNHHTMIDYPYSISTVGNIHQEVTSPSSNYSFWYFVFGKYFLSVTLIFSFMRIEKYFNNLLLGLLRFSYWCQITLFWMTKFFIIFYCIVMIDEFDFTNKIITTTHHQLSIFDLVTDHRVEQCPVVSVLRIMWPEIPTQTGILIALSYEEAHQH